MIDSILKIGLAACSLFLGMGVSESHALDAGVPDGKCSSLPAERRASVIASISKMSIGDSKRDVFAATGKPALVVEQYSKTARSAVGQSAYIFLKKCGESSKIDVDDNYVELLFDLSDRLVAITPVKVQGVERRSRWTTGGK